MADTKAFHLEAEISKRDEEQRLAFGWAYVADDDGQVVVDHSGDFIDKAALPDLESAVYDYVLKSRDADDMHQRFGGIAKLVEAVVVTPEKLAAMGLTGKRTGVWMGFKVYDDNTWQRVKSGDLRMFSIRGHGTRETMNA